LTTDNPAISCIILLNIAELYGKKAFAEQAEKKQNPTKESNEVH